RDCEGIVPESSCRGRRAAGRRRPAGTTSHRWQQDHGRSRTHLRLEPVAGADVLPLDIDVDEGRDVLVLHQLTAECREPRHQVVQYLAYRLAIRLDLPLAADVPAQRR